MSDRLTQAFSVLLTPAGLSEESLSQYLGQAMSRTIDFADLFLQNTYEESWVFEEGIIKSADFSVDHGFGVRVISGEKIGFAYANEINEKALKEATCFARSIVPHEGKTRLPSFKHQSVSSLYGEGNPLQSIPETSKVALLHRLDQRARKDARVKQVIIHLSGQYDAVCLVNSEGLLTADIRPLVYLSVRVIVEHQGQREVGSGGGGARAGYELFMDSTVADSYVDKAVNQAVQNLEAIPAPAGPMSVVLGPGWPAVLLHEAVGHGLEGDFNRKGSSAFSGRIGEVVASPECTVVDDGTLPGRRGSLTIDDEGTPTQKTCLIERGVLKNYLQDRHNGRLMKQPSTGNGRRESYAYAPIPRMTNTYLLPGKYDPQEIIRSVKKGIYAVDFSGGQVDITSGKFVFSMSEAYLIERGKITSPVKGATLIGNGPDVLTRVSMVGNDWALDGGIGSCGKEGQTVPVGVGQPTLKIEGLTVGGQAVC